MRFIAVSVLSVFVVIPAIASARLPVVNLSAAGVSARAAFGAGASLYGNGATNPSNLYGSIDTAQQPAVTVAPVPKKRVAQRAAVPTPVKKTNSVDTGANIIASASEVLTPRRPSGDLWAQNDTPLRMPTASDFSVVRTDAILPEESLDNTSSRAVANRMPIQNVASSAAGNSAPMAEIDAQIARLTELQRRADESFKTTAPTHVATAPRVASNDVAVTKSERAVVGHVPTKDTPTAPAAAPVKLSRLVVPTDDDVVVRAVKKNQSARVASVRNDMTKLNPAELRQAFRKTFLSENKHLSTYSIDDRFDVASDMSANIEGFTARRDLSEQGGIRPLEIKIRFRNDDSALSRDNYNLLSEYAGVVLNNPTRAIQVSIPQSATLKTDDRKLAARRLAIVEQVLRDTGVSEQRILPVLSQRSEDAFVLRIISVDQYETMTQQQRNIFGDTVSKKTYKSMTW